MNTTRLNASDKLTQRREDGSVIYWRTGKGTHKHASFYCANGKRDIFTGDCFVIEPSEVDGWAACMDCCTDADKAAEVAKVEAKLSTQCANNRGVANPQRFYSTCNVCGKEGKVNRGTGSIRAHKPQSN